MDFEKFHYGSLDEIIEDAEKNNLGLSFSKDFSVFHKQIDMAGRTLSNPFVVHPMEGCDATEDGRPSELVYRRYRRFAEGGSDIIWFEAISVTSDGRNFPNQLWINEKNVKDFGELVAKTKQWHQQKFGRDVLCIAQLTHSGRFSKPEGKPAPVYPVKNPFLDEKPVNCTGFPVVTDEFLDELQHSFVSGALLAEQAGFDGVDMKACHKYLVSELLSCYTREGKYGGSFENRTRFLLEVIEKVKTALKPSALLCSRLNFYDGMEVPYGFGVSKEDVHTPDFTETISLIKLMYEKGIRLINATMGSPYFNAHVNRPYDTGNYVPEEHPLAGVARLVNGIGQVQQAVPQMAIVGTGYSWLREFAPFLAAGTVENQKATFIGFGRQSFAYPDFVTDLLDNGFAERKKCCIACSKCAVLLRAGAPSGCLIKDQAVYAPIYKERIV